MNAVDLAQILLTVPADTSVMLDGDVQLADYRGEMRDGQKVLVLYAHPAPRWRPAVNGGGKYPWFLIRENGTQPASVHYHYGPNGKLRRYASYENAQRAAGKLNAQERAA